MTRRECGIVIGVLLAGCSDMPVRLRDTPELSGNITSAGKPMPGVTVALARLDDATPTAAVTAAACESADGSRATDSSGAFRVRATGVWVRRKNADRLTKEPRGEFALCLASPESSEQRVIFRAPASRWDSLQLQCDVARAWLAPDPDGTQGVCVVQRAGVDGQPLAARRGAQPALTCDTTATLIEPLRLGPIRINGSVPELRRLCPGLRDSMMRREALYGSGNEMVHVLDVAGAPIIMLKAAGTVQRIFVSAPQFRTRDSLGPGTRALRLLNRPDLHVVGSAEMYGPYAFAWYGKDCGVGYVLSRPADYRQKEGTSIPVQQILTWPDTTTIRQVVIGFCPEREYPGR
jgi:hypothetical protein